MKEAEYTNLTVEARKPESVTVNLRAVDSEGNEYYFNPPTLNHIVANIDADETGV